MTLGRGSFSMLISADPFELFSTCDVDALVGRVVPFKFYGKDVGWRMRVERAEVADDGIGVNIEGQLVGFEIAFRPEQLDA